MILTLIIWLDQAVGSLLKLQILVSGTLWVQELTLQLHLTLYPLKPTTCNPQSSFMNWVASVISQAYRTKWLSGHQQLVRVGLCWCRQTILEVVKPFLLVCIYQGVKARHKGYLEGCQMSWWGTELKDELQSAEQIWGYWLDHLFFPCSQQVYMVLRPHVKEFLQAMAKIYEVCVSV